MFTQDSILGIPLKDVLTLMLSAITAAVAIFNWRAARFRSKLKDDFEILRHYREEFGDDTRCQFLRDKIQRRMHKAYVMGRTDISDLISALAFFLSAAVAWLLTEGWRSSWRIGITLLLVGVGLAFIYAAFKDWGKDRIRSDSDASPPNNGMHPPPPHEASQER